MNLHAVFGVDGAHIISLQGSCQAALRYSRKLQPRVNKAQGAPQPGQPFGYVVQYVIRQRTESDRAIPRNRSSGPLSRRNTDGQSHEWFDNIPGTSDIPLAGVCYSDDKQ